MHSFVKLSREEVIAECENAINRIEEDRRRIDEEYIQSRMVLNNRFRRWFLLSPLTLEQTKERFLFPNLYGYEPHVRAKRLLKAAHQSHDFVYVDSEDIKYVWGIIPHKE
jgi:hypothetical protein